MPSEYLWLVVFPGQPKPGPGPFPVSVPSTTHLTGKIIYTSVFQLIGKGKKKYMDMRQSVPLNLIHP